MPKPPPVHPDSRDNVDTFEEVGNSIPAVPILPVLEGDINTPIAPEPPAEHNSETSRQTSSGRTIHNTACYWTSLEQ